MKIKAVSGIMLTLLLIGMSTLAFKIEQVSAVTSPYIAVDPDTISDSTLTPGENFTVSIYTDYDGSDVWAYEFSLTYNPSILHGIELINGDLISLAKSPTATFMSGTFNNTLGELSLTGAFFFYIFPPAPTTSGPGILANVTFTVVGIGNSTIILGDDTRLLGSTDLGTIYDIIHAWNIPDQVGDGYFSNTSPSSQVHNLDTGEDFATIQAAINDPETLNGHTIHVNPGIYSENVDVTKQLNIIGTGAEVTTVEASDPNDHVFYVTANNVNISGFTVKDATGLGKAGVYLYYSNYSRIENINASNNYYGVYLSSSSNNTVSDNNITNNDHGVYLYSSSSNTFSGNTIANSTVHGVHLSSYSKNNTFSGNTITNNTFEGVNLVTSSNNTVSENTITDNRHGVHLSSSSSNTFSGNTIANSTDKGVHLVSSSNNTFSGNTIANSTDKGVCLSSSSDNKFYHNNFVDNTQQVYINAPGYPNFWNSTYPIGGNYWSNYTGVDLYSGPNQDEAGSDGIGDTPHILDTWNQDNYPYINLWGPIHNINTTLNYWTIQEAVDAIETSNGHTIQVDAGTYIENVDVTKQLNITGAGADVTTVEASDPNDHVFYVTANNVTITGFTMKDATVGGKAGVYLYYSDYSRIENVSVSNNYNGIYLSFSKNSILTGNTASNNNWAGIVLESSSNNNVLSGNTASNNFFCGIRLSGSNNSILTGNTASNNSYGIRLSGSSNNTLTDNNVSSNNNFGICLTSSSNNVLSGNTASNNAYGIFLESSSNNNVLSGNTASNNAYGIVLGGSSNNNLTGNTASNNLYNFGVSGSASSHFNNYVDTSNTVDGKPIYYLIGATNAVYDAQTNVGTIYLINSNNITIKDLTLTKNLFGVVFFNTTNSKIENVTASNNVYGIWLRFSSNNNLTGNTASNNVCGIWLRFSSNNNTLSGNTASSNNAYGIHLKSSSNNNVLSGNTASNNGYGIFLESSSNNNVLSGNTASSNNNYGIYLSGSINNNLTGNTASNNYYGIFLGFSSNNNLTGNTASNNYYGIFLESSSNNNVLSGNTASSNNAYGIHLKSSSNNNVLSGNTASNNNYGIHLRFSRNNNLSGNTVSNNNYGIRLRDYSSNNIISGNNITNNDDGIYLADSSNNKFFHNNFVENIQDVYDMSWESPWVPPSINTWDNGYPSGGNYWSDHVTVDDCRGVNQDELGSDGIVDEPYIIDDDNRDNYPLVEPWSPVISVTIDIDPDTLNLKRKGKWITCHIELPEGYDVSDIDVSTVMLNGEIQAESHPTEIGDYDGDGIPDLMVKFNRAALTSHIYHALGIRHGNGTLTITGQLTDGTTFEGSDTIKVMFGGDADLSGFIDLTDFQIWANNYGKYSGEWSSDVNPDFDSNDFVELTDFQIWAANYGATVPSPP